MAEITQMTSQSFNDNWQIRYNQHSKLDIYFQIRFTEYEGASIAPFPILLSAFYDLRFTLTFDSKSLS